MRNGRRLRSAKQALAGTSAERATAREAGKIFENRNAQKAKCTWKLKPSSSSSSYTPHVDFFSCFLVLNFSYHRLGFSSSSFFFFFFPFSFSYSLRSPLCGTTPTPFFSSSNILLNFKVKRSEISANLFSLTFFSLNELVSRGGRARAKKKTREVCSALKQRQGSSSRPSPSAER